MSDAEINDLENFLLPFALKRFDLDSYTSKIPMGRFAKNLAKSMMGNWVNDYVTWLVRAFARCLFNIGDEIYLKDLSAITLAEASYMAGIGPFGPFQQQMGAGTDRSSSEIQIEAEVHVWLLHLQEEGKLPGVYERFTGRYFIK